MKVRLQLLLETFLLTLTLTNSIIIEKVETEESGTGHKSHEEKKDKRPIARFARP